MDGEAEVPAGLWRDHQEPVGRFSYRVQSRRWTWSRGIYEMHGFTPGEVVPTTDLMIAHVHPDDRAGYEAVAEKALAAGHPFVSQHRVIDAQRRVRTVLVLAQSVVDPSGHVEVVNGHMVEISRAIAERSMEELSEAVEDFEEHRAVIEQAKGVLTQLLAMDPTQAFEVLKKYSQHHNVKVRVLAAHLVLAAAHDRTPAKDARPVDVMALLDSLADVEGR
ncbi:MAG TPA: PAS and ANTAR domain-containing protein [Nocardioides sp.]|nr:PAS and ANTAR domain-containing protein [Nocardioides sp.]